MTPFKEVMGSATVHATHADVAISTSTARGGRTAIPAEASAAHADKLDLRPPDLPEATAQTQRWTSSAGSNADRLAPLGAAMGQTHASRAEVMVQRFRREGLPVARLWEGHSALLSLGLNQKGKPGLWLVQKTH